MEDVNLSDVDTNDTHTFQTLTNALVTVTSSDIGTNIGTVTVSMDENGNYTLSGAGIEHLGAGEHATVSFEVQAVDNSGNTSTNTSAPATVTLTIDGSNDAPIASNDIIYIVRGQETDITSQLLANDTDAEGDALSISSIDTSSTNGTVTLSNGDISYTYDTLGTDSFSYIVSDASTTSNEATVSVVVADEINVGQDSNFNFNSNTNNTQIITSFDKVDNVYGNSQNQTVILQTGNANSTGDTHKIDLGNGTDTLIIDTTDKIDLSHITNVENIQIHKSGDITGNTGADTVTITSNNIGTIDLNEGVGGPLDTVVINTSELVNLSKLDHVEMIQIAEGETFSGFDFDDLASSISKNPTADDIIRIVDTAGGNSEAITINLSEFKDENGDGIGDSSQIITPDGIAYDRYETTQGHFIDIEQTLTIDWQ